MPPFYIVLSYHNYFANMGIIFVTTKMKRSFLLRFRNLSKPPSCFVTNKKGFHITWKPSKITLYNTLSNNNYTTDKNSFPIRWIPSFYIVLIPSVVEGTVTRPVIPLFGSHSVCERASKRNGCTLHPFPTKVLHHWNCNKCHLLLLYGPSGVYPTIQPLFLTFP